MGKTKTTAKWPERPQGRQVGRFYVEFEVANNDDMALVRRGKLTEDKVRRATIRGLADSGATSLVLPQKVADALGLEPSGKVKVTHANGRTAFRDTVLGVHVSIEGREGSFKAVVEPRRETALIGAVILEELDFLVDNKRQQLVPRDPDFELHELE